MNWLKETSTGGFCFHADIPVKDTLSVCNFFFYIWEENWLSAFGIWTRCCPHWLRLRGLKGKKRSLEYSVLLQCTVTLLHSPFLFINQHLYFDVVAAVFDEGDHRQKGVGGGVLLQPNMSLHNSTVHVFFSSPSLPSHSFVCAWLLCCSSASVTPVCWCGQRSTLPAHPSSACRVM